MTKADKEVAVRSALTHTIAGLYCLICAIFGCVFPISDALTYTDKNPFVLSQAFHLILYIISIGIFIFFFTIVLGGMCQKKISTSEYVQNGHQQKSPSGGNELSNTDPSVEVVPRKQIAYHGEGMNLYIRIGAIVFTLGSVAYKLQRIIEPFEKEETKHCIRPFTIFVDCVFIVFVIMQTSLIFKHHQVVINLHKAAVRVCLMHLLATNLAIWVSACTREIVEGLEEEEEKGMPSERKDIEPSKPSCRGSKTVADAIAPYLFPCIIEYSLIGAAAIYRIYLNVAKPMSEEASSSCDDAVTKQKCRFGCGLGEIGLVGGVLIVVLTIGTVAAFYLLDSHGHKEAATFLFLATDITLLVVTLITVILAMWRMRSFAFAKAEEDSFDDKLLLLSLGGFYFYSSFIILSSARSDEANAAVGVCFLVREMLAVVQISLQTVMILDGFRRRADNDEQASRKPGRAVITILLACNFALWIVNTFEIKRAEISDIHVDYYSELAWRLVIHVSLPLVIFYRFHSTVCLSDIWEKAYLKEKED